MHIYSIPIKEIQILPGRQRKEFNEDKLIELGDSIVRNGLIHPVVVRREWVNGEHQPPHVFLVAGERRLRAMLNIWGMGEKFSCGLDPVSEGEVPCLLRDELSELDAKEIELDENLKREDLTWQERAQATADLLELRTRQAIAKGTPVPSSSTIAQELEVAPDTTRTDIIVARHLTDPDIAKASTAKEAFKILKRKEQASKSIALGQSVGLTFSSSDHTLLHDDCLHALKEIADETFDVILTDPPYGINAQDFGDSGGAAPGGGHFYDDSFNAWFDLMDAFSFESFRIAKYDSHAYVFCDIDNFVTLKKLMKNGGWNVFRTPIIWHNPTSNRAPWPDYGPQRKYQICLYAIKGKRPANQLYPDIVTFPSDENLGHQAQKPVALYTELLRRSIQPGNTVIDPFCGSGPIFPAAHALKVKATGIEQDEAAYGIAVKRLAELK